MVGNEYDLKNLHRCVNTLESHTHIAAVQPPPRWPAALYPYMYRAIVDQGGANIPGLHSHTYLARAGGGAWAGAGGCA